MEKNSQRKICLYKNIINKEQAAGKRVIGYGAPTKATLFLKNLSLNSNDIHFIIEDNELKVGCFLPKTGIPIISLNNYKPKKNDFIICFAWNFYKDIFQKLKQFKFKGTLFNIMTGEINIL